MPRNRKKQNALVTFRLPRELAKQIRDLEEIESETRSNVIRRLLRFGLETLPRRRGGNEAA